MSMRSRFWLPGMALLVGGFIAGICHRFNVDSPRDLPHVAYYPPLGALIHLVLFAAGLLVLLGWFGQYAIQRPRAGMLGLVAFVCLFLGILWADLMHSILEFSVFPVLDEVAPYALPGLAEATYRSLPVSLLLIAGRLLLFAGVPAAALAVSRSVNSPRWPAIPLALSALLQAWAMFPRREESVHNLALTALYFSMAALGASVLFTTERTAAPEDALAPLRTATFYQDSGPEGQ